METFSPTATPLASSLLVPADGDPPTGAVLGLSPKTLANAVRDLQNKVDPGNSPGGALVLSRCYCEGDPVANCERENGKIKCNTNGAAVGDRAQMTFAIYPPHGSTLNGLSIRIDGPSAVLPAVMPHIVLEEVNVLTGAASTIATIDDPTAVGTDWNNPHNVILTDVEHPVDRTSKFYRVVVFGHHNNGGGALTVGGYYSSPKVTFTAGTADVGAG